MAGCNSSYLPLPAAVNLPGRIINIIPREAGGVSVLTEPSNDNSTPASVYHCNKVDKKEEPVCELRAALWKNLEGPFVQYHISTPFGECVTAGWYFIPEFGKPTWTQVAGALACFDSNVQGQVYKLEITQSQGEVGIFHPHFISGMTYFDGPRGKMVYVAAADCPPAVGEDVRIDKFCDTSPACQALRKEREWKCNWYGLVTPYFLKPDSVGPNDFRNGTLGYGTSAMTTVQMALNDESAVIALDPKPVISRRTGRVRQAGFTLFKKGSTRDSWHGCKMAEDTVLYSLKNIPTDEEKKWIYAVQMRPFNALVAVDYHKTMWERGNPGIELEQVFTSNTCRVERRTPIGGEGDGHVVSLSVSKTLAYIGFQRGVVVFVDIENSARLGELDLRGESDPRVAAGDGGVWVGSWDNARANLRHVPAGFPLE